MNIRIKIIFSFSLIILLLSATGVYLIQSMLSLANETENIYKHPFAVSNATRDIKINLLTIQNYLKEMALTDNDEEFGAIREKLRLQEKEILIKFDLINHRFLGDKLQVEKARKAFMEWKKSCDQVILMKNSKNESLRSESIHINAVGTREHLEKSLNHLRDFATGKATEFYTKTLDSKRYSLLGLTSLLLFTILASIFILVYVVKNHDLTLKEMNRYFHLIDQNILTASVNKKGYFTDASNALCRFLNCTKKEMINQKCTFFITDDKDEGLVDHIYNVISTGSEWEGDIKRTTESWEVQWIHLDIHPVFDENFSIHSYNIIINDVTDKKTLEDMSITDKLTGLHNRRSFDEVIEKEIKLAQRKGGHLTLAILDIDFFKKYNDHYGHPAGDEVLANVAGVLKKILNRPNDYPFRLGGEEFGVLFSDTDHNSSCRFLEKIREEIQFLKIEHSFSDVSSYVSISIGARVSKGLDIPQQRQFYIQADQALYTAKEKRNKVVVL